MAETKVIDLFTRIEVQKSRVSTKIPSSKENIKNQKSVESTKILDVMEIIESIDDTQTCLSIYLEFITISFNNMKLDLNYGANLIIFMDEITMCFHPSIWTLCIFVKIISNEKMCKKHIQKLIQCFSNNMFLESNKKM